MVNLLTLIISLAILAIVAGMTIKLNNNQNE